MPAKVVANPFDLDREVKKKRAILPVAASPDVEDRMEVDDGDMSGDGDGEDNEMQFYDNPEEEEQVRIGNSERVRTFTYSLNSFGRRRRWQRRRPRRQPRGRLSRRRRRKSGGGWRSAPSRLLRSH